MLYLLIYKLRPSSYKEQNTRSLLEDQKAVVRELNSISLKGGRMVRNNLTVVKGSNLSNR